MRPRWIMLLLVAVVVLVWIAWPGGDEEAQQAVAGKHWQDGSPSNLLHADGEGARSIRAAAPKLVGRGGTLSKWGADARVSALAALLDRLASDDVDARRAAADQIVDAGYFMIEQVARQAAALDAESWQAFADAVMRETWPPSPACALVAAAHTAPEAHRRRLISLARRLNPEAGKTLAPEEIEALVQHELVKLRDVHDRDFFGKAVAIYGHVGMPATLRLLREGDPDTVDPHRTSILLATIAQPEDIPVLQTLLLEGQSGVARALGRLDALGFTEASDALIAAVRSGRFDLRIAQALRKTSKRRQTAKAVRAWIQDLGRSLTEEDRVLIAMVFAALASRTDVPLLEAWSATARDEQTLVVLGKALMQLGSLKGVDVLVRIVGEKKVDPPPRQGPEDTGRLRAGGFGDWYRGYALRLLNAIAVQLCDSNDERGPWTRTHTRDELDQAVPSVRAWWAASRDKMQFDEKAGEWRLASD